MHGFCHIAVSDFWRCVLGVSVGGAIGGLLYWTSGYLTAVPPQDAAEEVDDQEKKPEDESKPVLSPGWLGAANAFTGFGGAWAVALAMLWAKRMPVERTLLDELELLGTSIVAGYAGTKLLPMIADRLTKEFVEKSAKDAQKAANEAVSGAKQVAAAVVHVASAATDAKTSRLITEAIAYLDSSGNQTEHQTADYVARLQDVLSRQPTLRQAAVLLGRMYAQLMRDNQKAIGVMREFLAAKKKAGEEDEHVADAYWNLANYMEFEYAKSGSKDPALRTGAIDALAESIRIAPGYKADYLKDDDFEKLREDPEAKKRLEQFR
jgi:hypothetical protein